VRKKLGVALGSGSARGWSHIGVLNALAEAGITVDYIAGTSIGSVVGAVFSIGDIRGFERFVRGIDWKGIVSLIDVTFPGSGLIPGKRLFRMLSEYYRDVKIENLPVPYCAVAADVETGEEVRFTSGRIIDAVRASVSIPGIFTPFRYEGRILVDGGIVNPVPVDIVREMGADVVLAVDLNSCKTASVTPAPVPEPEMKTGEERESRILHMLEEKYKEITGTIKTKIDSIRSREHFLNILEILDNSANIVQRSITENQFKLSRPDLIIEPRLGDFRLLDFDRGDEAIDEGYSLTCLKTDTLKDMLG